MTNSQTSFTFEISLSVLNHLGRQRYRSFATVLGEAISNAWDADAHNVHIQLEPNGTGFWIKDDGVGMTADDFQNKFLKIGYSKRKGGAGRSPKGRPFIGRKGIGKLALLSCAQSISVLSKVENGLYVGGRIDNSQLDLAITQDLTPQQYTLGKVDQSQFEQFMQGHEHGTIIYFDGLKNVVKRSSEFLRKTIALYFRFSLLDKDFKIFVDGKQVTHEDLKDLVEKTEFLWKIDTYDDPFIDSIEGAFAKEPRRHETKPMQLNGARGFLATVEKPRDLKILTTDERVGVDLFVNGRLRERDILKHIPTARVVENYLYGQIHFDSLDDDVDRFTSSREGIVADDPKFQRFLGELRQVLLKIIEDWDEWRRKHRKEGDPDNESITKTQRAAENLYNTVATDFEPSPKGPMADKVDHWVDELRNDASFNFESYAECFISENLIRKYIADQKIPLSQEACNEAKKWREREKENKNRGNISITIRRDGEDLNYLSMDDLANLVDKPTDKIKQASLARDATEYKPLRDAVAHTALLTDEAKERLKSVRKNIKARVRELLGNQRGKSGLKSSMAPKYAKSAKVEEEKK